MLGLRFINQIQLDLWCGPIQDFSCDLVTSFEELSNHAKPELHIAIVISPLIHEGRKMVFAFREIITDIQSGDLCVRRITFVTDNIEQYYHIQSDFFAA